MKHEFRKGNWSQLLGIVGFNSVFFISGLFSMSVQEGFPLHTLFLTGLPACFLFFTLLKYKRERLTITHEGLVHESGEEEDVYSFREMGRLSKDTLISWDSDGNRKERELFRLFNTAGEEIGGWSPGFLGSKHNRGLFVFLIQKGQPNIELDADCERILETFMQNNLEKRVESSSVHTVLDAVPTALIALLCFAVPIVAIGQYIL